MALIFTFFFMLYNLFHKSVVPYSLRRLIYDETGANINLIVNISGVCT